MADNTNQDNLSLEQDLIKLLQQRQGIGEGILDDSRDLANVLRDQTKYVQFQVIEKNKLRSIGREIVKIADQTYAIDKKDLGTQKSITDLAKQRQTLEKSLYTLSSLQNKIYTEDEELNREINQSIEDQIKNTQQLLIETGKLEKTSQDIANNFGVKTFGALSDITKSIPGLKRFSEPFDKAAEAAREVGAQNSINKKEFQDILNNNGKGLTKEKIKQLGLEKELGGLAGSAAAAKAKSMGLQVKSQNTFLAGAKSLGPSLAKSFGPLMIIEELKDAFISLDNMIGNTAKNMGISYQSAASLNSEFVNIANESGNIFITTKGINESFNQINQALGTNAALSDEILIAQTELTKQAFYSVEAATMLSKLSIATGKPTKEIAASFLGSAKALNIVNNTAINEKQLLEDISKLSKDTLATFADQPGKLAEAAYEARKLGLDLQKLKGTQSALLDIESSIAAEFEAEVITGKQLNLERARYFALTNDYAGLAKELGKQDITRASFAKMNVLQQESIAKAMGMSADTMGEMLMDQETMSKLSGIDGDNAKEKFNNLVKQVGMEEAKKRLGDETLANQMQSASIQDRFNASIEKLKEVFVSLVDPLMPILDVFSTIFNLVGSIMKLINPFLQAFGFLVAAATDLLTVFNFAEGKLGSGASGSRMEAAALRLHESVTSDEDLAKEKKSQQVQDGIASPDNGPFSITDKYGATAITATGDGLAVSPNINTQSSPIIDYEKLGMVVAKAIAANPIQATTYFDMNEHGRRYQKATAGITTRKL
jgi:hypothetical protein